MPSLLPIRFRTELARSFHRDIVSTLNVPDGELNTLNTLDTTTYIYTVNESTTTITGQDDKGKTLAYIPGRLEVFVDGDKVDTNKFLANDGDTIVLETPTGEEELTFTVSGIVFSDSDVNSSTDTISYAGHGLETGDIVVYKKNSGTPIVGLVDNTPYYVIKVSDNEFKVAANLSNALSGTQEDINALVSSGVDYLFLPYEKIDVTAAGEYINIEGHGLSTGDIVIYRPTAGTTETQYFVIRVNKNNFTLATTLANANNDISIDLDTLGADFTLLVKRLTVNNTTYAVVATSGVNTTTDIITYTSHPFVTGDAVIYSNAGGTSITGLTSGSTYYVYKLTANTFKLYDTYANSLLGGATGLKDLTGTGNNSQYFYLQANNQIIIPDHGLATGQTVRYSEGTGSIGGLSDTSTYYVIKVNENALKLTTTLSNALTDVSIDLLAPVQLASYTLQGPLVQTVTVNTFTIYNYPNPRDYFYIFLAKPTEWDVETVPPTPVDSRFEESQVKRNILGVKKINASDTCLLVRRIDWESGTIYDNYDDSVDLSNLDFYVFNQNNFRIYKCLDNNNGNPSTVLPSFSEVGPKTLSDGYIWQLMYEVPAADRTKFLNDDYVPVKFYGTSTRFDHNGTVTEIILDSTGSGYISTPSVLILGDGVGATATATMQSGLVTKVELTNGGSGYSFAFVQIVGGGGSGASASAIIETTDLPNVVNQNVAGNAVATSGQIDFIKIVDGGTGYLQETTGVSIVGNGTGAAAEVTIVEGVITEVIITDRGSNYTFADVVITGDGVGADLRTIISPQGGHGSNIPQELLATTLGVSLNIEDFQSDFFLDNDFRQYGIIKNINQFGTDTFFTENTGNGCFVVTVPDGSEYNLDDVITTDGGGKFIVAYVNNSKVYLLPSINNITENSVLTNVTTGVSNLPILPNTTLVTDNFVEPDITQNSGNIIFLNNIPPLQRQDDQTETIKMYINF